MFFRNSYSYFEHMHQPIYMVNIMLFFRKGFSYLKRLNQKKIINK